ncbi:MAG: hypothetical protein MUO76_15075, partial [Anaerolineaceae bacterium]|nr:hypothetical protein [Anaerolineaceae bacterium]
MKEINAGLTTKDVFQELSECGKPIQEWGKAVDGSPMLSVRSGGDKQPRIFITAGAHSTETAGVHAAINMIEDLETDHEVHILPLRDPYGFAGVKHCLSFAAAQPVNVSNHMEAYDYLNRQAEKLWHEGEMHLFKLGKVGFVWDKGAPGLGSYWNITNRIEALSTEDPETLRPLWGKSVMMIDPLSGVEGAQAMQRCWHALFDSKGKWLHLNRMFGLDDAVPEVAAVDKLMQTIRPGLTLDLHEGNGQGFWLPIPKPRENVERSFKMAKAFFDYVHLRGYPVTDYEEWLATDRTPQTAIDPGWMKPEPRLPGLFWVDTRARGEGHNLMSYAELYGVAFG